MAMAGVWQDWEEEGQRITSCAIFTTEANAKMADTIGYLLYLVLMISRFGSERLAKVLQH